jgi:hypothetical protein
VPIPRPDCQRVNLGEHALGSFVPPSGVDHFWRAHASILASVEVVETGKYRREAVLPPEQRVGAAPIRATAALDEIRTGVSERTDIARIVTPGVLKVALDAHKFADEGEVLVNGSS